MSIGNKWCDKLSRDNPKLKLYMAHNLLEEASLTSILIYFVTLHKGYIEITLFFEFFIYFNEIIGHKSNLQFDYWNLTFFWS